MRTVRTNGLLHIDTNRQVPRAAWVIMRLAAPCECVPIISTLGVIQLAHANCIHFHTSGFPR